MFNIDIFDIDIPSIFNMDIFNIRYIENIEDCQNIDFESIFR